MKDLDMGGGQAASHQGAIEPGGKKSTRQGLLKWLFFIFVLIYVLISYYHAPILTLMGRFLIVEH